jgi:hypothetical protein
MTVVLDRVWSLLSGIYLRVLTFSFLRITRSETFLSSWEFFTTLDYEWRVIRGRLPDRHAIWVSINGASRVLALSGFAHAFSIDLLPQSRGLSHERDTYYCRWL